MACAWHSKCGIFIKMGLQRRPDLDCIAPMVCDLILKDPQITRDAVVFSCKSHMWVTRTSCMCDQGLK